MLECYVNAHCCYDCPNIKIEAIDERFGYGIADDMGLRKIRCVDCYYNTHQMCDECLFYGTKYCKMEVDKNERNDA